MLQRRRLHLVEERANVNANYYINDSLPKLVKEKNCDYLLGNNILSCNGMAHRHREPK